MEKENETFKRHNKQNPFSSGVDKLETAEKEIHGHCYVMGEICQTENPVTFHPRRYCEDSI